MGIGVGVGGKIGVGVGDNVGVGVDPGMGVGVGLSAVIGAAAGVDGEDVVPASALASSRICIERGASDVTESAL
jgi:hypothetical protein